MSTPVTISVVVCAHTLDRLRHIGEMVSSVRAQTYPAMSLIIVCDHSEALFRVLKSEFKTVEVIRNEYEKGLSGARNTGVKCALGDVVAFLDDDAAADPCWLEQIAIAYEDPAVMAVGGSIAPAWTIGRPKWFPYEFDWVNGCSYIGLPRERRPVRNLIGCNMSVRRNVLEQTGGFRSGLGRVGNNAAGCEETEFFIRAKSLLPNQVILYEPQARVRHHVPPARCTWKHFMGRCRAEGRSKAQMARLIGPDRALSNERSFAFKTLPEGVLRNIGEALRGDLSGLARAGAILTGLTVTTVAYCRERVWSTRAQHRPPPPFEPIQIIDWDLGNRPPSRLQDQLKPDAWCGGAFCLFRSKGTPIAIEELRFDRSRKIDNCVSEILDRLPHSNVSHLLRTPSGPRSPWVTVVVATRDRPDSLLKCLDSLLQQSYSAMNIIVVDNAPSSNATADLIAGVFAPSGRVQYAREDRAGLGTAHNTGLALSLGDIVAFTDDDVIVDPNWVATIASEFSISPKIGCVTGMILPAELETRAQYWVERHGGFGKGVDRRVYDLEDNKPADPLFPYTAGTFGSGANMAFRRKALVEAGAFDGALGAGTPARGGDDLASFVAILEAGYQLVYSPGAIVWHFHRRAEAGVRRQAYGYGVGLGAYLTKQVFDNPGKLFLLGRKFPAALTHLLSSKSEKMVRLPDDYPRHLIWRERFGILMGLPGYLQSRFKTRRSISSRTRSQVLAGADPSLE
ncbi:MAG: glycosyltransferase [Roseibium sp.]|uniref:glycosyltransferase n=1 Tax=Roseibium sp. TaxID=1936156 RepID=UPI00261EA4F9|nr:glycosyltransferase [Roseibium sp.]MCV0424210.1 glycosyltransferase [Roseibium sp.]